MMSKRDVFLVCCCGVLLTSVPRLAADELADVGKRKQLFVDDHIVACKTNVERRLGRVEKANQGRPIFTDGWFYGTVQYDRDRFKLWFRRPGKQGYGYAESKDGLHFAKKVYLTGINFAGDFNLAVELNRPDAPPQRRFIGGYDAPGMAAGLAHSADGIRWTVDNGGKPVTFRAADCHNQIFWDPLAKTYRLITRTDYGSGGGPLAHSVAKNFEVRGTRAMTNLDIQADPTNWKIVRQWWFNREGAKEYLRRQIYSMTVWIYEGVYFALMSVYEFPADVSEGRETDHVRRHERDVMDFYIATSRDCDNWDLHWIYAGKPIVPRGPDRSFDKDFVFPSSTVVTHDDKHWLYYGGANERHGTAELKPPVWFKRTSAIGLATLRLDGFVSLHAKSQPGIVETRPFLLTGDKLLVNVDGGHGAIQVELLDKAGKPIAGFSGADAPKFKDVDMLRFVPKWRQPLSNLRGKAVRLRFRLTNADLYSFQIH